MELAVHCICAFWQTHAR